MARKGERLREELAAVDEEMVLADGFDDAIIGYVEIAGGSTLALYDREKCIKVLMQRDKMSRADANEFFDFNVVGSYVGDRTPAFATIIK